MKCDICGEEVDNSQDLAQHMERMHPPADDKPEQDEAPELPEERGVPQPAQGPGR